MKKDPKLMYILEIIAECDSIILHSSSSVDVFFAKLKKQSALKVYNNTLAQ